MGSVPLQGASTGPGLPGAQAMQGGLPSVIPGGFVPQMQVQPGGLWARATTNACAGSRSDSGVLASCRRAATEGTEGTAANARAASAGGAGQTWPGGGRGNQGGTQ
eukprot:5873686-Alexandrium_andersonii.AAC.1